MTVSTLSAFLSSDKNMMPMLWCTLCPLHWPTYLCVSNRHCGFLRAKALCVWSQGYTITFLVTVTESLAKANEWERDFLWLIFQRFCPLWQRRHGSWHLWQVGAWDVASYHSAIRSRASLQPPRPTLQACVHQLGTVSKELHSVPITPAAGEQGFKCMSPWGDILLPNHNKG